MAKNQSNSWTPEEVERLRALWPTMGADCVDQFPGRKPYAVQNYASRLKLKVNKRRPKGFGRHLADQIGENLQGGRVASIFELGGKL